MSKLSEIAGLPEELLEFDKIEKETSQRIKIFTTTKRFRKLVTIIEGIAPKELETTAKELKHKFACGGSAKDRVIVLQGNHKEKVRQYLIESGYPAELITVI
ncbi:hypothetical protein AUJ14_05980 [Candidatus Micrarchaeota archaeon CG1_02_55_22]|nr:MAG: hypothetical protein AUJ14_05980 [Candidatus Micrarchaeota archaeon CG1_02_55_22]